jgi:serine/threonine protein kinase
MPVSKSVHVSNTTALLLLLQPHGSSLMTTTMGTPAFMAPEMCGLRSGPFAPFPAEVWAVGVCLFMFVYGRGRRVALGALTCARLQCSRTPAVGGWRTACMPDCKPFCRP